MLQADNVTFAYSSSPCINNISICVNPGEVVGLPGPSGIGKSTLGALLAGFLQPHSGTILCDGKPLSHKGFSAVQLLCQHPELSVNPRWKISKIIEEGNPEYHNFTPDFRIPAGWLTRYPHELSGGELQRIVLLRAMNSKTRYLIADEITSSLDTATQALIWNALLPWAKKQNIGIVAISHNTPLLNRICSRIYTHFLNPA